MELFHSRGEALMKSLSPAMTWHGGVRWILPGALGVLGGYLVPIFFLPVGAMRTILSD
jgi:hypothetical protein